jgi:hypothetical protein
MMMMMMMMVILMRSVVIYNQYTFRYMLIQSKDISTITIKMEFNDIWGNELSSDYDWNEMFDTLYEPCRKLQI